MHLLCDTGKVMSSLGFTLCFGQAHRTTTKCPQRSRTRCPAQGPHPRPQGRHKNLAGRVRGNKGLANSHIYIYIYVYIYIYIIYLWWRTGWVIESESLEVCGTRVQTFQFGPKFEVHFGHPSSPGVWDPGPAPVRTPQYTQLVKPMPRTPPQ